MAWALKFDGINDKLNLTNLPTSRLLIKFKLSHDIKTPTSEWYYIVDGRLNGGAAYFTNKAINRIFDIKVNDVSVSYVTAFDAKAGDVVSFEIDQHSGSIAFAGRANTEDETTELGIEYIEVTTTSNDTVISLFDATASDHSNTGAQPVLVDTIGGNNAVGVNFPTDGSAWVDLGGSVSTLNFDLDYGNSIYSFQTNDVDLRTSIFESSLANVDIRNNIYNSATSDIDLRNKTFNAAWFDVDLRNAILALAQDNSIITDLDVRNSIHNAVNADLDVRNKILKATETDIDFRNSIMFAVSNNIDVRNMIFNSVSYDVEIRNKVFGFTYSDLDIRNRVDGVRTSSSVIENFTLHPVTENFSLELSQKENFTLTEQINIFTL